MNSYIILKYMNKLTKDDIKKYALNKNIKLSTNELDLIYTYIKKYPKRILDEPLKVINEIKTNLSDNVYNKLLELYQKYTN